MSESSQTPLDLDALMRRIRDDVARRKATAGRSAAATDAAPTLTASSAAAPLLETIALPRLPETSGSIVRKERYALADFLAFQDEDFVRNAYRGILRREPDADGFATFLEALRQGRMAKAEVLGRMRFSAEGRIAGVPVRGLPLAFALRSARRVPVLGRMLGIIQYLIRLPDVVRNHEQFEAAFFQRQLELNRQINSAEGKIERAITQVQRSLQDVDTATRANIDGVRAEMTMAARATALERHAEKAELDALAAEFGDARREYMALAASKADQAHVEEIAARVAEMQAAKADRAHVEAIAARIAELQAAKADATEFGRVVAELREQLAKLEGLVAEFGAARREYIATAAALAASKADRAQVEAIAARIAELQAVKTDATEFGSVVGELRERFLESGRVAREQERRLTVLIEEARRKYRARVPGAEPPALAQEADHMFDAFYAAFENRFRGTPDDIRQRVAVYLPMIREARAGTAKAPVLDIGCGRGEWLELLKENGLEARGVDLNRVTVAQCRERGLAVLEGDAIEHLRGLKTGSLGAVTAIHVIEHIPFARLVVLFDEVLRALRPGGVAVFETPNPENLMVGACSFYYDSTHERPLPPEPTRFLVESRGFVDVSILRLHPVDESLQLADGAPAVRELINRVLYGAQDYALIARKPKR